jgi:hypothetical protein
MHNLGETVFTFGKEKQWEEMKMKRQARVRPTPMQTHFTSQVEPVKSLSCTAK